MSMSLQCLIEFDFLNLEQERWHFPHQTSLQATGTQYIVTHTSKIEIECSCKAVARLLLCMKLVIYIVPGNVTHRSRLLITKNNGL